MKMERLLEWQRDLADKLGVTIQELQEVPLPAEEDLDKLKEHLEMLQAERDKRAEIFLNIQVEIKDIMGKDFCDCVCVCESRACTADFTFLVWVTVVSW